MFLHYEVIVRLFKFEPRFVKIWSSRTNAATVFTSQYNTSLWKDKLAGLKKLREYLMNIRKSCPFCRWHCRHSQSHVLYRCPQKKINDFDNDTNACNNSFDPADWWNGSVVAWIVWCFKNGAIDGNKSKQKKKTTGIGNNPMKSDRASLTKRSWMSLWWWKKKRIIHRGRRASTGC